MEARTIKWDVALAPAGSTRCWDLGVSEPIKDLTVWLISTEVLPAVGNLGWRVYYGGAWVGKPFDKTSTHSGGISQSNNVILGSQELAHMLFNSGASALPANANIPLSHSYQSSAHSGVPVVVELTNNFAVDINFACVFISRSLSDRP
jgi:hypothetical protein